MEGGPLNGIQTTCTCGTIAPTGRIFCPNCGWALRATPLIPHSAENESKQAPGRRFGGRAVVLMFSLGALADFIWATLEKRSVAEAIISAFVGLFGTALYLLIYRAAEETDPDDPNWPARMVP